MKPSSGRLAAFAVAAALASGASAEERKVGAWSVGLTKERAGTFAATVNESGGQLGQYCYPEQGSCIWIIANDVACEAGDRYALLVNTDSGAAVLEMLCLGVEGKATYAFADFDAIDAIVRKAKRLVMAFPTANGLFQLTRFSLDGATRAVAQMREVAEGMSSSKPAGDATGISF